MSLSIPEHYRRAFADNFQHAIQQEVQKLGTRVMVDNFTGKSKVYQDMDEFEFVERVGRLTNSNPSEVTAASRQLTKVQFKCQKIFDRKDDEFLGTLGRPDSEVMQGMRFAWNRTVDTKVALAAVDSVYGGVEPYVTPTVLPSSQKVQVDFVRSDTATNSNLTPAKILKAVSILKANEINVNEEECYIAMDADMEMALTGYVEVAGNDVWARMISAYMEGKNSKLFGLTPVMTERLPGVAGDATLTKCIVWTKRQGICVAPDKLDIHIDVIPTRDHAIQISAYGDYGFMRRYEKAVVEIMCKSV
jgi:hypothetical protein